MRSACLTVLVVCACGGDGAEAEFPADYAASYVPVRPCRSSPDHDLNHVLVFADPGAAAPYRMRDQPFPAGAVILKPEYDFSDDTCSESIQQWTVMVRLAAGSSPATLDWHWQKVDARGHVVTDNEPRCYGCHATCGVPPDGYLGTCSVP